MDIRREEEVGGEEEVTFHPTPTEGVAEAAMEETFHHITMAVATLLRGEILPPVVVGGGEAVEIILVSPRVEEVMGVVEGAEVEVMITLGNYYFSSYYLSTLFNYCSTWS